MAHLTEQREHALSNRLDEMRHMEEWRLFQNFVLGLLPHDQYKDVRLSAVRSDFGRDGVAITPEGKKCFVAVSFDCSLSKIRGDAKRWTEDPNREDAEVMVFVTNDSPQNTKVSKWIAKVRQDYKLELRVHNHETILSTATREGIWRETCARLGISGHRQGYTKVAPYDGELVRRALKARPRGWLRERVPLPQWKALTDRVRNRLVFGKPGSGKTTTIFEQLERAQPATVLVAESDLREAAQIEGLLDQAAGGAVIVFDDLHDHVTGFVNLCQALRARQEDASQIARRYEDVYLLAAARSQEWEKVRREIPMILLQDLGLLDDAELTLTGLDKEQCRHLIEICRDEWDLLIEDRLLQQAAKTAAEGDGTPLYVISMLAAARGSDDLTLRDQHLAGLPRDVRDLWKRYWDQLDAISQGVLRTVRLFWGASMPAQPHLLFESAKFSGISPSDLSGRLDALERSLWLTRTAGVPSCLDVQLEVIVLDSGWLDLWDRFIFEGELNPEARLQLHNGTGIYYAEQVVPRTASATEYRIRLASTAQHFESVGTIGRAQGNKSTAALSLSNASNCYRDLAGLEKTLQGRREWLDKAREAVGEAVAIRRELGLRRELAITLNNASSSYSDLAGLETTREGRAGWLNKAIEALEEAIAIQRELGPRGELAASLNNASVLYGALAGLETTREGRRGWLDKAIEAVEEAPAIYRKLGLRRGLASSLNNASSLYGEVGSLEKTREGRRGWMDKAREAVEETVAISRKLERRGDLASSLTTASNCYFELSRLQTTPDGQRGYLDKARMAVEEAVTIRRELGVGGDLAGSLNNASVHYRNLAALEKTREGQRGWLDKAREAVEEAVAIRRELGMRGSLAIALGSLCRLERTLSEMEIDPAKAEDRLTRSREAIDEGMSLFRDAGDTPHLLLSMQDAVTARLLLVKTGVASGAEDLLQLVDEGIALASSMKDEEAKDFFTSVKRRLIEGAE